MRTLRAVPLLGLSLCLVWFWPNILAWLGWTPADVGGNATPIELARSIAHGAMKLATGDGKPPPSGGAPESGRTWASTRSEIEALAPSTGGADDETGSGGEDSDDSADPSVAAKESELAAEKLRDLCAEVRTCGNGFVDFAEDCDGENLSGQSCSSLGYEGKCKGKHCPVNTLACSPSCRFDTRGCTAGNSGQPARFVDNGDGTVTDRSLRVMWEKKCTESTCPAESQLDRRFDWVGATSVWLMALNSAGDRGFAGYDDWRLPTVLELSSLPPSGSSASGLGPTADRPYWSSSTSDADPARAWRVSFRETAKARLGKKSWIAQARAVRELSSGSAAMHIAKMPTECRTMRLCGNGVVDDNEACDGRDLAGQTCLSLGYAGDCSSSGECVASGLGCTPACRIDPTGCTSDGPDAARFVTDWDGTAIDRLTGLQWQRKCSGTDCSGGRHAGEVVDWQTAVTKWVDELNREDEKSSGAVDRWRLPNVAEARSILGETWKCGDGVCNTPEILGFEGPEEVYLWTSTTSANDTARAWRAALHEGSLDTAEKTMPLHALAVRLHSPRAAGSELAARQ